MAGRWFHVVWLCVVVCGAVQAQDTRLAQQAGRCSVVLELLAQAEPASSDQAARWHRASALLAEVQARAQNSTAEARQARSEWLAPLQAARDRQDAALSEDVVVCGAWAEGFLAQGAQPQYVPVYPKVIAPGVRSVYTEAARRWLGGR